MHYRTGYIIIIVLLITGCVTVKNETFPANLPGMIYDDFNNPVDGADILLKNGDSQKTGINSTYNSDIDGRFLLPNLDPGNYTVTISREGFESQELSFRYNDPKQVLYIKLTSLRFLKQSIENALYAMEWEEAARFYDRAVEIDSEDPVLAYLNALALFNQGKQEAGDILTELLEGGIRAKGIDLLLEKINHRDE